jgi:hypothetical protein
LNIEKPPGKLSPKELKKECLARVRSLPNVDPKFISLKRNALSTLLMFMLSETVKQSSVGAQAV